MHIFRAMRLINTKAHAVYDYFLVLVLLLCPNLFNYARGSNADVINILIASFLLLNTACTKFELGVLKVISLKSHLLIDLGAGILLAASPWLFAYSEHVYKPQLVFGLSLIVVALLTDRIPSDEALKLMGRGRPKRSVKRDTGSNSTFSGFIGSGDKDILYAIKSVKKHLRFWPR